MSNENPNEKVHEEFETVVFGSGTSPQSGSGMSMPEEVLSVGDILCDTYILRARLGRGGMGEVWKADEVYEGEILRTVVIKTLAPNVPNVQEEMARIQSMFHKIHSLQHQHICPMYAMKNDPKAGTIIVMKYIDGMMLQEYYAQYLRANNEFPVSEVVRLLLPIAQALDYSHSKSVLHR
ncbi:MAG: protein kinase, partial [Thermoguttaceae bacterium]|nr:protein kinase [Thermoguttaceae bacterium]